MKGEKMHTVEAEKSFKLYYVGFKGILQRAAKDLKEAMEYGPSKKQIPLLEMVTAKLPLPEFKNPILLGDHFTTNDDFLNKIREYYGSLGFYGPYGDVIQVDCRIVDCKPKTDSHVVYAVDFVAHRAYHKPGLAADLVLFLQDVVGRTFFVGIKRSNAPGKNKPALVGGFMDVKGYHLQTPAETLLQESVQEASIKIKPDPKDRRRFREEPFADNLSVQVTLGKGKNRVTKEGELLLVKTVNTSKQERVPSLRLSRVNRTTAYALKLMFHGELTIDYVRSLFTAGDDAKEMFIVDITNTKRRINFGITHHRKLYHEALRKVDLAYLVERT